MPDIPDQPTPPVTSDHGLTIVDDSGTSVSAGGDAPVVRPAPGELEVLLAQGGLSPVAPSGSCSSYRAGHETHYIMGRTFHGHGRPGTVVGFDGDLVVVRAASGETFRWWHHHPLRLRATIASRGRSVTVIPELPALRVDGQWFYCSTEPSPCHPNPGLLPRTLG